MSDGTGELGRAGLISLAAAVGLLPPFLFGASALLMRPELAFERAGIGVGVTAFFTASALTYTAGGRLADRLGARPSMRLGALCTSAALAAIASTARALAHVIVLLVVCGLANAVTQPATSLALSMQSQRHQGVAFGMRQSAAPISTLAAGVAVPVVGLTWGWRWSFAGAAVLALVVAALVPTAPRARPVDVDGRGAGVRRLAWLALPVALASATPTTFASYFVEAATEDGLATTTAAWLLAIGSGVAIVTRLVAGWWADQQVRGHLGIAVTLLALGSLGYVVVAVGGSVTLWLIGTLLVYGIGWGWTGLLMLTVVRAHPQAAGMASGIIFTGLALGAAVGPITLGFIAEHSSFRITWSLAAVLVVVATVSIGFIGGSVLDAPVPGPAHVPKA